MDQLRASAAIAATHELKPGRYPDHDTMDLLRLLLEGAMRAWRIDSALIDGVMVAPIEPAGGIPDMFSHQKLNHLLGLRPRFAETIAVGGATFPVMAHRAMLAIAAGTASAVLCVGVSKFVKPGAGAAEEQVALIAEPDFEAPYGPVIPALYAMIASQFMARRGASREDIARVAVSARKWALLNPDARMYDRGAITIADVLASPPVAKPFHYLDCSIPSDGGGVFLIARSDIARRIATRPAYVLGFGEMHKRGTMTGDENLIDSGAVESGRDAFRQAGLAPADIDVVQLYDAFSATPLILLENLGFCAPGTAAALVQSGATDPGGSLPMNTGGGLLSYGHTGHAGGMSLVLEAARQVMDQAGAHQVADARIALAHCYAGMMFDHATLILGNEP